MNAERSSSLRSITSASSSQRSCLMNSGLISRLLEDYEEEDLMYSDDEADQEVPPVSSSPSVAIQRQRQNQSKIEYNGTRRIGKLETITSGLNAHNVQDKAHKSQQHPMDQSRLNFDTNSPVRTTSSERKTRTPQLKMEGIHLKKQNGSGIANKD